MGCGQSTARGNVRGCRNPGTQPHHREPGFLPAGAGKEHEPWLGEQDTGGTTTRSKPEKNTRTKTMTGMEGVMQALRSSRDSNLKTKSTSHDTPSPSTRTRRCSWTISVSSIRSWSVPLCVTSITATSAIPSTANSPQNWTSPEHLPSGAP